VVLVVWLVLYIYGFGPGILAAYGVRQEFVGVDQGNAGTIKVEGRGTLTR
jgi:hypothetical protein